jgi:hypothetical protein
MKIKYHLNNLDINQESNDKSGRVDYRGTLDENDISEKMLKRGTGLTKQEIIGVLDLFTDVLSDQIQSGFAVVTRLANFRPGIKGVFKNATDPFDPNRHLFRASISEGVALKKKMRAAVGERQVAATTKPVIVEYYDHSSATTDEILTQGNIGEIKGEHLKFDQSNSAEGIFFIHAEEGTETRAQVISLRTESRLMFLIPNGLTAGEYLLEVRREYTGPKDIRSDRLSETLSVSPRQMQQ